MKKKINYHPCHNCGGKDFRFLRTLKNDKTTTFDIFYCTECRAYAGKMCDRSMSAWLREFKDKRGEKFK